LLRREAKVSASRILFPVTDATIIPLASDYASAAGAHPTINGLGERDIGAMIAAKSSGVP
jgi:hypothetical protein